MRDLHDMFRRAESRRAQTPPQVQPLPIQPVGGTEPEQGAPARVVVPQPIRENSVYRQLMRSHDRMHTRHLKG